MISFATVMFIRTTRVDRRRFIVWALAASVLAPLATFAQRAGKPARVAVLSSSTPETRSTFWDAFRGEMKRLGWTEGQDLVYVYRYTRGDSARFDALAAELVAEKPDLIYASSVGGALAAKRATREIPIVFGFVSDPVGLGLVASLARPGGNATGFSSLGDEVSAKYLELLKEVQPKLRRVSVLAREGSGSLLFTQVELAGHAAGIEVNAVAVDDLDRISQAFQSLARQRPDGVVVQPAFIVEARQVAERMAKLRVPAIYSIPEMVAAGGLMSYGAETADNLRRAAGYVDRILKGANPADLPVQQPQSFELVVNLKAARAQGIKIPQSVLLRATKVIE